MSDNAPMRARTTETEDATRFAFGANWREFLDHLTPDQIEVAKASIQEALDGGLREGTTFLDVGSGSGLLSLAARSLGARVRSFDFDAGCVACAESLKTRFFPGDPKWTIEQGS